MGFLFGAGATGGGGKESRLLQASAKWFAFIIALLIAILFTPDLWSMVEGAAASWISTRYQGFWAMVAFWTLKLGAYPLVFFGARLAIALFYMAITLVTAFKLFDHGPR